MPTKPSLTGSRTIRLLVVDDDAGQRSLITSFLKGQGFETEVAESGEQALKKLEQATYEMMVSDVRMPGISGLETLHQIMERGISLPVVLVTAFPDIRDAVGAMRDGAVNYLQKPIDLDELLAIVCRGTGLSPGEAPVMVVDKPLPEHIVAKGTQMRAVFRDAALVAGSDSRILITGESGVGKEVLADLIHSWSARVRGPMIKVNCAAIPETLLESELFGHEKGAFTGAHQERKGRFEEAHEGTILLDEITEMSPHLQAKLLRVIQDGRFQRLGSNRDRQTNARILAATNRNLEEQVASGAFREDLFYRLNVMEIYIPPLRDRPEDILDLAAQFFLEFTGRRARLSPPVVDCFRNYNWPGNVRELRNAIERASLMCHGELVLLEHLPTRVRNSVGGAGTGVKNPAGRLEHIEREAIVHALRANHCNRTETAKALGISRRALTYKIQRFRELGYEVDSSDS